MLIYTPEVGMNLHMLRSDIKFLQKRYELDEKGKAEGRLVIKLVPYPCVVLLLTSVQEREGI